MEKQEITLKNGQSVIGDKFDEEDLKQFQKIFLNWKDMNADLKQLGSRNMNVPEVLSEGLFCIFYDAIRTNSTGGSFDCVKRKTKKEIQVKSASIKEDLTSFGPVSTWDELYFIDFAPEGEIDGTICFYEIKHDLKSLVLNKKKGETFEDQQKQGRRPRFSIKKEIIEKYNVKPDRTINILANISELLDAIDKN